PRYLDTCFELIFRSAFFAARLMSAAETPSVRLACLNSWRLIGRGFRDTPFPSRSAMTRNAAIRPNGLSLAGIRYQGANFVDVSSATARAVAAPRAACEPWPGTPITLRQGIRVIEDNRRWISRAVRVCIDPLQELDAAKELMEIAHH